MCVHVACAFVIECMCVHVSECMCVCVHMMCANECMCECACARVVRTHEWEKQRKARVRWPVKF